MISYFIKDCLYKLKWQYQRNIRGYADPDIWDFNAYLLELFINGLPQLKQRPLSITKPSNWNELVDDMVAGFKIAQSITAGQALLPSDTRRTQEAFKARKILTYKEQAQHNKAFKLFNKYFYNLKD